VLALAGDGGAGRAAADPGINAGVIDKWPAQGVWRVDVPGAPVNFAFQALAALTLLGHPDFRTRAEVVAAGLLEVRGARFDQSAALRQDNSLQAWPWVDGTFSWVEPTAGALILLKKLRGRLGVGAVKERIDLGERVLFDRVCSTGGWNYGGSNVYGQELFAYVPTTAWGILALQDRRNEPAVAKSIARLQTDAATEPTAQALALSVIAMRAIGSPSKAIADSLEKEVPRALELRNNMGIAMALYALGGPPNGERTFGL
jgi:hypothetical protein